MQIHNTFCFLKRYMECKVRCIYSSRKSFSERTGVFEKGPRTCSVCRSHIPVLFSYFITGTISGTGTALSSGAHDFPRFLVGFVWHDFQFQCNVVVDYCLSFFPFFSFWPSYCMSFCDLQLMITSLQTCCIKQNTYSENVKEIRAKCFW